jgi:hypothetical protein
VKLRFCIPDSVMVNNQNIPDELFDSIGISREDGFFMLDSLMEKPVSRWISLFTMNSEQDSIREYAEMLTQQLTVPVRMIAVGNNVYEIHSDLTVRYNRLFNRYIDGVSLNHNPVIRWAGIYKVAGAERASFHPVDKTGRDTLICLFTGDTSAMPAGTVFADLLLIEKNFTYFAAVDSGVFEKMICVIPVRSSIPPDRITGRRKPGFHSGSFGFKQKMK